MRISDWSSDVCSSELPRARRRPANRPWRAARDVAEASGASPARAATSAVPYGLGAVMPAPEFDARTVVRQAQIGRASCKERVCQYVLISVVAVSIKQKILI